MIRWWAVIAWLLAAGPAGANVPSAGAFGYDAVGNRFARAVTAGVLTNQTHNFDANAARGRVDFGYDGQGWRIAKTVLTNWNGSGYQATNLTRFVYDLPAKEAGLSPGQAGLSAKESGGWNLLAELDSGNGLIRSYTWGLDLSGSLEGAGVIGGLLMVKDRGDGSTHFPCYDGNGNVGALVDAANGNLVAEYTYGPCGELVALSGPLAKLNPLRFSTQYQDEETDLLYYGYRYYSPSLRRWVSRDPVGEEGGRNLYGFANNYGIHAVDRLGLEVLCYYNELGIWTCKSPQHCRRCSCKKVIVHRTNNLNARFSPDSGISIGVQVNFAIEVEGDPTGCVCRYSDSGKITTQVLNLPPKPETYDPRRDYRRIPCQDGYDRPGVVVYPRGDPKGTDLPYDLQYDWIGTVSCTDSTGTTIQDSAQITERFAGTLHF